MSDDTRITKENIDEFFKELGKEIRKGLGKNAHIELIVVGGASVLLNYNFRDSTRDIDALINPPTSIKDIVNKVGDKYGLENGWVNSDFKNTKSYSPKLIYHSKYYKEYNHALTVRTVEKEYLVAMKLASLREYKNDKSDIVGILSADKEIDMEKINKAVNDLYNGWENMPEHSKEFAEQCINEREKDLYQKIRKDETKNKEILSNFEKKYENVLEESNINAILKTLKEKEQKEKSVAEIVEHQAEYSFDELINSLENAQKNESRQKKTKSLERENDREL